MKKLKIFICMLLVLVSVLQFGLVSNASTPYANYFIAEIGGNKMTMPTPASYEVLGTLNLDLTDIGSLNGALDMCTKTVTATDESGNEINYTRLYISDTQNNRIVVLTNEPETKETEGDMYIANDFRVDFVIEGDANDSTDPSNLKEPNGIYVDDNGTILIADTRNFRLVEFTERGNFRYSYAAPESELLGDDFEFQPLKVIKDDRGYIYVTNVADYRGILLLTSNGEFSSYYGAGDVTLSLWESIIKTLWSSEDLEGSIVSLPYTFQNIYAGDDGYIYATTTGTTSGQMRKINSAGSDVSPYESFDFSDPGAGDNVSLYDVTVDEDENLFVLDNSKGRIYEYDKWGKNLFVFGTNGSGTGQFSNPQSIVVDSNEIVYVLDSETNLITMFKPTTFADKVHAAEKLFSKGMYEESFPIWQEVLDLNNYYVLALQSMGSIYYREEEYDKSLEMYYKAEDATNYSTSFVEKRYDFIRENFSGIRSVIFSLLLIWFLTSFFKKRYRKKHANMEKKRTWFTPIGEFFSSMWQIPRHPIDGFEGIRYENKSSYGAAIAVMLIYFVTHIASVLCESFIYRDGKSLAMTNWWMEIGIVFLPWLVVVIVNYGITTIMYGEGRFRDIFIGGAFCLTPLIFTELPLAILTNVLSQDEATLYSMVQNIVLIWVIFNVFMCMCGIHGFHYGKGIIVFLITAVGVAAVVALFMLVYGLAAQMFTFFIQFGKELSYLV